MSEGYQIANRNLIVMICVQYMSGILYMNIIADVLLVDVSNFGGCIKNNNFDCSVQISDSILSPWT